MKHSVPAMLLAAVLGLDLAAEAVAAPVNINKASAEEIAEALNGIGLKKAQDIVAFRDKHGPFKTVEQLRDVKGVGDKVLQKNKADIRLQ